MRSIVLCFLFLVFYSQINAQSQSQTNRYKVIQGFGYLHTQVDFIISHWADHPLNHKPVDEHEAKLQEHIINEIEFDEEWVEFMMVEDNIATISKNTDQMVVDALHENLRFYHMVLTHLRNPEEVDQKIKKWEVELKKASINLYDVIYRALCD